MEMEILCMKIKNVRRGIEIVSKQVWKLGGRLRDFDEST
jgi:hypothetical protein